MSGSAVAAKPGSGGGTNQPPALTVTTVSPNNGQTVAGSITWEVTVTGATAKRVDFAIDGVVSWSQSTSPYRYGGTGNGLDTTKLSEGVHTLTATALGVKGSKGASHVTVTVANAVPPPPPPPRSEPAALHWGAQIGDQLTGTQAPWDMNAVTEFEAMTGKGLSLMHFASPFANCSSDPCWFYDFPTTLMERVRQHGAIPFFSWASQSIPWSLNEPDFQLSDVISGRYDAFITNWATAARDWGHPFFLRFNFEMNGNWFPWAEGVNGNQPGEFVPAWRHVHDIFTSVGATNVTWTWCPNIDPYNSHRSLSSLYPGDAYVDWTCLDGYNWGTNPSKPGGWMTFDQLYGSTYQKIADTIAPSKPMVIGEIASSEYGGSKAGWIEDTLARLVTHYPKIFGLVWFNKYDSGMDWPIETSASSIAAFAGGIQDPAYATNTYGDANASPVPPPPPPATG